MSQHNPSRAAMSRFMSQAREILFDMGGAEART